MEVRELNRVFKAEINKEVIVLEDPNINLSVDDVKEMYSAQYPQLLNSQTINHGIQDDKLVYEFKTVAGTKG